MSSIRAMNAKKNDPYYLKFVSFVTNQADPSQGEYYDSDYHDGMYYRNRDLYINLFGKSESIKSEHDLDDYHIDTLYR